MPMRCSCPSRIETFDAVVCQFGAMFFPDKSKAYSEAHRVLRHGGVFVFSVWDRIAENEFADTVTTALESMFPEDPPRFLARTPHGYHDQVALARDLASGGFAASPEFSTVAARSPAESPQSRRSLTAKGRRYGTRSRRAMLRGSVKRRPCGGGHRAEVRAGRRRRERSKRTLSPLKGKGRKRRALKCHVHGHWRCAHGGVPGRAMRIGRACIVIG